MRSYTELSRLSSFEERYRYLRLSGAVGEETFGFDRILNQNFYTSAEWKRVRDIVIIRDNGCDLGAPDHVIYGERIVIHHMNPVLLKDLTDRNLDILNPEFLICTTHKTHNAIHYGDERLLPSAPIERTKYDTCPWKL